MFDLTCALYLSAGDFVNSTANGMYVNAVGQWLADPVAVLVGTADNAPVKTLVKLSSPSLGEDKTTLTFQVRIAVTMFMRLVLTTILFRKFIIKVIIKFWPVDWCV